METTTLNTEHNVKLMSAEIANLWTFYMNDSMSLCVVGHFLEHIEDEQTRSVLEFSMQLAKAHIRKLQSIFTEEKIPVPDGFTELKDRIKDSPRLFTDDFYHFYIQNVGKVGLEGYAFALQNAARLDICEYFTECLSESSRLLNKATEIMLSKGTYIRSPYIPAAKKVEYVQKQSYLAGWFGDRRPLNAIEISNIYLNLIQNQMGRTLLTGFSQVAESKQVRDYFIRGRDIADKHVEIFGSLLSKDFLPSASAWSTVATDSTISPFSDKLMMFHVVALNGAGIGHYGRSLGTSPRHDLGVAYTRLIAEIGAFADDGAKIMIDNGWLEQVPQASDRDKLAE